MFKTFFPGQWPGYICPIEKTKMNIEMGISEELKAAQEIQQINIKVRRAWGTIFSAWCRKSILMIKYQRKQLLTSIIAILALAGCAYMSFRFIISPDISQYRVEQIMKQSASDSLSIGIPQCNIDFMVAVATIESGGKWDIVGGSGGKYYGAFQFGDAALTEVGLKGIDKKLFLNDTSLQLWAMNRLMAKNYIRLSDLIEEKHVPIHGGVRVGRYMVTVSGLLAASHLVGVSNVRKFLKSNGTEIAKDGNGVPLTDYFQLNNMPIVFTK